MLSLVIPTLIAGALYSPQFVDTSGWSYPASAAKESADAADTVDVNTASPEVLQRLPGIGPMKAGVIVRERERRPFRKPSDLLRVRGIGRKTLKRMAPMLRFERR